MRAGRAGDPLTTVFLDRDGVLNRKAPEGQYVTAWADWTWLPGALDALRALTEAGLTLVVVTNQRGIARGRVTEADFAAITERMLADAEAAGGRIAAVYHCPHEGGCACRKPGTELFERAAHELPRVRLEASAVVGDRASDMEAGERIGALRVHVRGVDEPLPPVDYSAADLGDAAAWLLSSASSAS